MATGYLYDVRGGTGGRYMLQITTSAIAPGRVTVGAVRLVLVRLGAARWYGSVRLVLVRLGAARWYGSGRLQPTSLPAHVREV